MDYTKNRRLYSLLGQRGTFGTVLDNLAKDNERIFAVSADLTRTSGLERFSSDFPERFLNAGIAEENALAFAAGLADSGYIPFVTTFSNFAALRSNEFVRHFMAYMKCNVKLVGFGAGFAMELFGNTHYGLEDIGAIRSMPNIKILSPADGIEVARCVEYAVGYDGPVYIRLTGKANNPIVHKEDFSFDPEKAIELRDGAESIIFATGSMVNTAVKAADKLSKIGISVKVIDVPVVKPIDRDTILANKDYPLIISLEEHCVSGGLGSAIAEILSSERSHGKLVRLGTSPDKYFKAGSYEYMLSQHGLTVEQVTEKITNELKKEKNND